METGARLYQLVSELYPICRSITGDGVRKTLAAIRARVPIDVVEVPSGTPVLDWTIPKEWNISDAWIKDSSGRRIVDFARSNLHVVSYSTPIKRRVGAQELRQHLHSLPEHPDWIPYRTSYYNETWGFCVPHRLLASLTEPDYDVCIDSSLTDGSLSYGELVIPGASTQEVLISCHVCHPSLCDDNLSGISVAVGLAQELASRAARRYSYRFLFIPGTIGSIAWLARNRERATKIKHGLVLTCVGDAAGFTYKKSRRGDAQIDRVVAHVLKHAGAQHTIEDFVPYGYDERQYCSPGFDLPVGCLMRAKHGTFPEYHTSADNLDFVSAENLAQSLGHCIDIVDVLERDVSYRNTNPYGEPQLGRRGLYATIGGDSDAARRQLAMLWVLNFSDGKHSLLDIAERANVPFGDIASIAQLLEQHALLVVERDDG